jgi:hypothetical protein
MPDNKQIKDGLGDLFTIRMRDISAAADGSLVRSLIFATAAPVDFLGGGSFHRASKSGTMVANIGAAAPIYSFQWPSATAVALIRRIRISAWSMDVGFTPGIAEFDMVTARAFVTQLSGGAQANLAGNSAKLRTTMGSSQANIVYAQTAALTGGTYTADPGPGATERWVAGVGGNVYTPITTGMMKLFEKAQGEMPLWVAKQEGFIIQATVPQTGTWSFSIATEWDEVPPYTYGA